MTSHYSSLREQPREMETSKDPLHNGAIFKFKVGSLRSPPKIVQFEVPKGSVTKTPTVPSTVNSEVRNAFDHIYRQTPTPKLSLGGSMHNMSSVNSPYWASNLQRQEQPMSHIPSFQTPIVEPVPVVIQKFSNNSASSATTNIQIQNTDTSTTSSKQEIVAESAFDCCESAEPELVIKPVKRPDSSHPKPQKLSETVRLKEPNSSRDVSSRPVASARIATSTGADKSRTNTVSNSRSESRSRTGGADSLLSLFGAAASSSSSSTSSSRSGSGGTGHTRSGSGGSRGQTLPTTTDGSASTSGKNVEKRLEQSIHHKTSPALLHTKALEPTLKTSTLPHKNTAPAPDSESESQVEIKKPVASVSVSAGSNSKRGRGRPAKRKQESSGESEPSESDASPAPAKAARLGGTRGDKGHSDEEEGELTVTRSGRKSMPKKTIPLAEDAMQSGELCGT